MKVRRKYRNVRLDHLDVQERGAVVRILTNGHKLIVVAETSDGAKVHREMTVDEVARLLTREVSL